jgi:hypothetical protein
MATDDAHDDLAPLYVRILELVDQGVDQPTIADRLDLDLEAVPGLVELATAKRRRREG